MLPLSTAPHTLDCTASRRVLSTLGQAHGVIYRHCRVTHRPRLPRPPLLLAPPLFSKGTLWGGVGPISDLPKGVAGEVRAHPLLLCEPLM